MKITISIPDDIFAEADLLASRLPTSRSQLYAQALAEFVARLNDDHVTEVFDAVIDAVGTEADDFTTEAARQMLSRVEW